MTVQDAVKIVQNPNTSVSTKTRALYYLRCLDNEEGAMGLTECMTYNSVLIDHEVAYVLGQMKQPATIPFLFKLIEDESINPIVRHEAIEAVGNFENKSYIPRLEKYLTDANPIIKESAVLAIKKLEKAGTCTQPFSKYYSRDPAYPFEGSFEEAKELFFSNDIEKQYNAIFYFRDLNTKEAVDVLAQGFKFDSALLKHEIAYVFGQMENPLSVDCLLEVLQNEEEADIVRHEAAEALGNIGCERAQEALNKYLGSNVQILNESANVGLGISNNDDEDYADIDKLEESLNK